METNVLKTTEHIVMFIDVLGASSMIKDDADKSLNIIHLIYRQAITDYNNIKKILGDTVANPIIRIFSDNIVVACPVEPNGVNAAFRVIFNFARLIPARFIKYNILVRGGITKGSFFYDDVMIWGRGLVDAYNIESNLAVYPRIVIDENLFKELVDDPALPIYVKKDIDEFYYVDYLYDTSSNEDKDNVLNYFEGLKNLCVSKINETSSNPKILQKYYWHKNYLETKIKELTQKRGDTQCVK